jgi:hypothetical protein
VGRKNKEQIERKINKLLLPTANCQLLTAYCSFLLPDAWIKSNGIRSFPEGNTVCGYFPAREIIYGVLAEHFRAWRV